MGQYYLVVNVDKRQFLHPHCFSDGLKLMEFGASGCGTMAGLAILLADGNGRGGGDCRVKADPYKLIGSWAGDRIVVTGDYADNGKLYHTAPDDDQPKDESGNPLNLYSYARVRSATSPSRCESCWFRTAPCRVRATSPPRTSSTRVIGTRPRVRRSRSPSRRRPPPRLRTTRSPDSRTTAPGAARPRPGL